MIPNFTADPAGITRLCTSPNLQQAWAGFQTCANNCPADQKAVLSLVTLDTVCAGNFLPTAGTSALTSSSVRSTSATTGSAATRSTTSAAATSSSASITSAPPSSAAAAVPSTSSQSSTRTSKAVAIASNLSSFSLIAAFVLAALIAF
ncbi:hypothetical protein HDU96_006521 [Phlyctochytrium bullatum]|nr:hypothetical protein HDU96_006521 [Phlyctochytrium bullatum]